MGLFLEKFDIRYALKYLLYMLLCMAAQNMLLSNLRLAGVCPLILPAVAVAVGMFERPSGSALFCVIMGVFADMCFVENTVFFTIALPAVAFGAAFVSQFFINRRFFAFMALGFMATLIIGFLQMLLTFAGDAWSGLMVSTVLIQSFWTMPFAAAVYFPPARWIKRSE